MLLDLTRYRQPSSHLERTFAADEVGRADEEYRVVAPVRVDLTIHKDRERFRLVGTVTTELELTCSRCLDSYRMELDRAFDLRYVPAAEPGGGEREVPEEDLDTAVYRDDTIDLHELLREQFYLALPMKPLCRESCQGLCPQCGTNRNTGSCTCVVEWQDPRLAALKGLRH